MTFIIFLLLNILLFTLILEFYYFFYPHYALLCALKNLEKKIRNNLIEKSGNNKISIEMTLMTRIGFAIRRVFTEGSDAYLAS